MKKRFLSVIVLSAALLSVQAQEGKGGISPEMLGQIKQSYQGTAADKALRNAIGNNIENDDWNDNIGNVGQGCNHRYRLTEISARTAQIINIIYAVLFYHMSDSCPGHSLYIRPPDLPPPCSVRYCLQSAFYSAFPSAAMSRATCTPLADAWEREWVTPLPSPII